VRVAELPASIFLNKTVENKLESVKSTVKRPQYLYG